MRRGQRVRLAVRITLVAALWFFTTEPWGMSIVELLIFAGPGAILGLAASWIAAALTPGRWRWSDGLRGAALGAGVLPPILAILVALAGAGRPQRTLESLVLLAWFALGAGAVAALVRYVWRRTRPHRRARVWPRRGRRAAPTHAALYAAGGRSAVRAHSIASNHDSEDP